jgi:5-(aminomethyl)-3-furanmethanol phosphate kinase
MILIKLGGSLFSMPELKGKLRHIIQKLEVRPIRFLVGGGEAADVVREWDKIHHLSAEDSHWIAIHSMRLSAHFVERLLQIPLVSNLDGKESLAVFEPINWLMQDEMNEDHLSHCWDVTSDSIAMRIAIKAEVEELIFLKSTAAPSSKTLHEAIENGSLDVGISSQIIPSSLRIGWINLRADEPERIEMKLA